MQNKKILIVGAGITGVALAALLEKSGHHVDIIEKSSSWTRNGYGITVMPTGLQVLRSLGIVTSVRQKGSSADGFDFLTSKGKLIRHIALKAGGIDSVTLDRADLHNALRSSLKRTKIKMGQEITALHQSDGRVNITFKSGKSDEYDLVVGADGVRSSVRKLIFPEVKPLYAGAAVWTFFLPDGIKLPPGHTVMQVWNDNEFMGVFPFKDTAAVTFCEPLANGVDIRDVDLREHFSEIDFMAAEIIDKIGKRPMYSGYLSEIKLHDWYKGNVVLAGDAAHAMMPATGMGASMGLADAKALADLILSSSEEEWEVLPQLYQHRRKRIADRAQREAYLIGRSMFLRSPLKEARNEVIKAIPQFVISHMLQRA